MMALSLSGKNLGSLLRFTPLQKKKKNPDNCPGASRENTLQSVIQSLVSWRDLA